jgi:hypothetical protein
MLEPQTEDVVRRAKAVYQERLQALLEHAHRDQFLAIEPDSGDYFLGDCLSAAAAAARQAHPDRMSFVMRIGHPAALEMGAATKYRNRG